MANDINIVLRQIKQQPLTVEELDQNFLNLKAGILGNESQLLNLGNDAILPFGDLPAFEMYTDGTKMVIESKVDGLTGDDIIFEVKDGTNDNPLFQITKDGRMIGTLDPSNMDVDWNELITGPSGLNLVVDEGEAYTLINDYNDLAGLSTLDRGKGTIAFAGGDIYLNDGED